MLMWNFKCLAVTLTVLALLVYYYKLFHLSAFSGSLILHRNEVGSYLIHTNKCRIPEYKPFNKDAMKYFKRKEFTPCSDNKLLSSIVFKNNSHYLKINKHIGLEYTNGDIYCCYNYIYKKNVKRKNSVPLKCIDFNKDEIKVMTNVPIYVKCSTKRLLFFEYKIYENVHFALGKTLRTKNKLKRFQSQNRPFNVLVIRLDGISNLNFIRTMNETNSYIQSHRNWQTFNVYHKVGLNMPTNVVPMLTGFNEEQIRKYCQGPKNCTTAWNLFDRYKYVTALFEDAPSKRIFKYKKRGFYKQPTDHYGKLYNLACNRLLPISYADSLTYCTGPEVDRERIWKKVVEFVELYRESPYFGMFWLNSYDHGPVNSISRLDHIVKDYIAKISALSAQKTIVFFLSDQGMGLGEYRKTLAGFHEDGLPFLHIYIPKLFEHLFPKEYASFLENRNRLITPYDLYMTLQHILQLTVVKSKIEESLACPNCKSIFQAIDVNRSCDDVNIEHRFCLCYNYEKFSFEAVIADSEADKIVQQINLKIQNSPFGKLCRTYTFFAVLSTYVSQKGSHFYGDISFLMITLETRPRATFEALVEFYFDVSAHKYVSRLNTATRIDNFDITSACVPSTPIKDICFCK